MARFNFGTSNNDTLFGVPDEANTFFAFGVGADKLVGSTLGDLFILRVDTKPDIIDGGRGQDTVDYSLSDRGVSINLTTGKVTAEFGVLKAVVSNLTSIENATGSNFSDTIIGTDHFNIIDGGLGNDLLDGGGGLDTVSFESHDQITIGAGDQFNISLGRNGADGNADWLAMISQNTFVERENDTLRHFQNVIGSKNSEHIGGNEQDNTINGRGGDDVINGFEGNDILIGGDGDDRLIGSVGIDTMTGGTGADRFLFVSTGDSPYAASSFDLITDFEHGIDKLDLSRIDADDLGAGQQHFTISAAEIPNRGQVSIFYDAQHDISWITAATTDSVPDFKIEVFGHVTASDLIL